MEEDDMEMTKEELQKWIREEIKKIGLISPDVLEKCNLLQSLLERREKQVANFLKLCESVTACEATVKKLYSLLGWEYRDTDSDADHNITGCGNIPSSPCEFVHSETQVPSPPAANGPTLMSPKRQDSANLNGDNGKKSSPSLKRELVVVLTRLPKCEIAALRLPTPQNQYSEQESLSNLDTEIEWEPENDSTDPDYSFSGFRSRANKRRKIEREPEDDRTDSDYSFSGFTSRANKRRKNDKNNEKPAMRNSTKTSALQASTNTYSKRNTRGTSTPQGNRNIKSKSNTTKTSQMPANNNGVLPVCTVSTPKQSSDKATKVPPSVLQEKVTVGMTVLARRRAMNWQRGKIMEIVKREDGGLKYKINFDEKGKSLVSGHHIAFHCVPKVDQLFVGARVVVKCQDNEFQFSPGILAELPGRKNHSRFLVFIDDHTPVYVGLPLLHLVCRPLTGALDDIPDSPHRFFMRQYIKDWPYPHLTRYRAGQSLNAELNGVQQRCEVLVVDCSLIQVVFQDDQHKEWIHRGSIRLEHVAKFLELKNGEEHKAD